MGYTTSFDGEFKIDRPVDNDTYNLLKGLNETRRMARNIKGYGVEGEFYVDSKDDSGQVRTPDIIDYNRPPRTQPGLWCNWTILEDKQTICWDGGEKFYYYVEWLEYIVERILKPKGYVLSGSCKWKGEESEDLGKIVVKNNKVTAKKAKITY